MAAATHTAFARCHPSIAMGTLDVTGFSTRFQPQRPHGDAAPTAKPEFRREFTTVSVVKSRRYENQIRWYSRLWGCNSRKTRAAVNISSIVWRRRIVSIEPPVYMSSTRSRMATPRASP
jgi:hypothetical protein